MILKQLKYYNGTTKRMLNNPVNLTLEQLISGYEFQDIICNEILIKTLPGTVLYINDEKVCIGNIGVYNIPVEENVPIYSLRVDENSAHYIENQDDAFLIITFIQKD